MLDENIKVFVMYITSLSLSLKLIYPAKKTQIALLLIKKVKIPVKYLDLLNVFFKKKALILLALIKLNQHAIKL